MMKRTTKSIAGGWLRLSLVVAGLEFHGPGIRVYEGRCSAHHQKFMLVPFCTPSHTQPSQPSPQNVFLWLQPPSSAISLVVKSVFRAFSKLFVRVLALTNKHINWDSLKHFSLFSKIVLCISFFLFFTSFSSRLQSTAFFVLLSIHSFCFPLFSGGMFSSVLRWQ